MTVGKLTVVYAELCAISCAESTHFSPICSIIQKEAILRHSVYHSLAVTQLRPWLMNIIHVQNNSTLQARRQVVSTWGHHDFLRGHLIMFLPVCEFHFSPPSCPIPQTSDRMPFFIIWRNCGGGHKTRMGARYPVPPLTTGLRNCDIYTNSLADVNILSALHITETVTLCLYFRPLNSTRISQSRHAHLSTLSRDTDHAPFWLIYLLYHPYLPPTIRGGSRSRDWRGHMASVEREPIMGVWGCAPSGVQGQSPWSGGQSPPEAEPFLVLLYV